MSIVGDPFSDRPIWYNTDFPRRLSMWTQELTLVPASGC
jgi:hypothetical protein